jgi:hypothetical protein
VSKVAASLRSEDDAADPGFGAGPPDNETDDVVSGSKAV